MCTNALDGHSPLLTWSTETLPNPIWHPLPTTNVPMLSNTYMIGKTLEARTSNSKSARWTSQTHTGLTLSPIPPAHSSAVRLKPRSITCTAHPSLPDNPPPPYYQQSNAPLKRSTQPYQCTTQSCNTLHTTSINLPPHAQLSIPSPPPHYTPQSIPPSKSKIPLVGTIS